ncbi:MAG: tRNA (adenosine(37)-N6)-dimethylallyltransferase MiaA [bacterium]|nr:tRNA (adenosine(37)-N6)-dimethylallyltransferase MiaA [bacterium]
MDHSVNPNGLRPPIVVVSGPTASGKSALALALAQQLGGEIVNADSVQIYKRFDIGSAKPSQSEMAKVPHHLFSVLEPDEQCNLGLFIRRAEEEIAGIHARGGIPVVTGGTGLYVQGLLHGVLDDGMKGDLYSRRHSSVADFSSAESSPVVAASDEEVYTSLQALDPLAAAVLNPADRQRVRRALEVAQNTGRSLVELQREHGFSDLRYPALVLVVLPDRKKLYRRIDERVDRMLASGFIEEVQVICRDFGGEPFSGEISLRQCPALSAIGYRHMVMYLDGQLSLSEAVALMKRDTRRFAKRQYTWWRNQPVKRGWRVEADHLIFELSDIITGVHTFLGQTPPPGLVSVRYLRYSPDIV